MPTESTRKAHLAPVGGPVDWKGTARYEIVSCIGRGGMGVVYEAFDRERLQRVALKTLLKSSPAALYLFKQEFRTLADVHHRNLVNLYELVATEEDHVFFTMELVSGTDFLRHVQRPGTRPDVSGQIIDEEPTRHEHRAVASTAAPSVEVLAKPSLKVSPADVELLRPALRQLVQGVGALHAAGKLHRDIKPSNVRVTPEGRVVLLDFGVATELSRVVDENLLEEGEMVGTARYMAPEQAVNEGPTPACDWYSVGVILYETLVGSPPFVGSAFDVLKMKSMLDPPAPSECVEGVPPDLDQLCCALLQREPEMRPTGAEILHRLGVTQSVRPTPAPIPVPDPGVTLVGREAHLKVLRDAFDATRTGQSVTVRVFGQAGMGKSSVVQHFLDGIVERSEAVVLRGRAYERESVPYKAVDSVVDALSRHLMRLNDREDVVTLPQDLWALARLFPVLRRVPSIGSVEEEVVTDPRRVRRRAFLALRDLLASLAKRQPLVLFVDGVQWGDADSAALLVDLVRPPRAPPLLLILAYRDEDELASSFLTETRIRWPARAEVRELPVGPLDQADATSLALALLGADDANTILTAQAIASESSGSPFLVEELARSVTGPHRVTRSEDTSPGIAQVKLEQMVKVRLARLPEGARRLVHVVAVAGRPLPVSVAADAAGVHDAVDEVVGLVRARRFVRTGIRDGREVVETIHDRIREMIVAQLTSKAIREHHRQLAGVLESSAEVDPEAVAAHLLAAGERQRSARYAELAAEKATTKLAFDRAAHLYRLTLETVRSSSPEAHRLRVRLAEVLESAGRGTEAARVYLDAAERAPEPERVELERAAAEQLLTSGRIDEGAAVLHRVLAAIGMKAPRTAVRALLWLGIYRVWLFFIGLKITERPPSDVPREDRVRIDALYSVSLGFALVDTVLGACMQARHLIHALRAGDSFQILRAVSLEATNLASVGGRETRRQRALHEIGLRLAERLGDAEGHAFVRGTHGIALFLRGRFQEARETLDQAAMQMTQHRRGGWQANAELFGVEALSIMGQLQEVTARHARLFLDAEERGDLYAIVNLRSRVGVALALAADDPDGARKGLHDAMSRWSNSRYLVQHWQAMHYEAEIDLYTGDGPSAYERLTRDDRRIKGSILLRAQVIRVFTAYLRGRSAIASIASPDLRGARLTEARRAARDLERERVPWAGVFASIVRASVANHVGDRRRALDSLREAVERATAADLSMHASAVRHQLGSLLGGEQGRALVAEATEAMAREGVRVPSRMANRLVPGPWAAPIAPDAT